MDFKAHAASLARRDNLRDAHTGVAIAAAPPQQCMGPPVKYGNDIRDGLV